MDQRKRFIEDYLERALSVRALATAYDISRKTANKWLARFREEGMVGIAERPRAPKSHPNETERAVVEQIIELRRHRRFWGPKKLLWELERKHPDIEWPAQSTIGEILKREGLIQPRKRRKGASPSALPLSPARQPNEVWATDFKGWFRTGDGRRVDPLTLTDVASRYILKCQGLERPRFEEARPIFEEAFREFGLPLVIRSDNGAPFSSKALGGISALSVWWIRLGIRPERIKPAHPEQNGQHERMHKTLKQATAKPPAGNLRLQQKAFDEFRRVFNEERPHEAIGMNPPGWRYKPSPRAFPERLPELEYGPGYEVRAVRSNGQFKWFGKKYFLSELLIGERFGLLPQADGLWAIDYGAYRLGYLDEKKERVLTEAEHEKQGAKVSPMCPV